MVGIDPTTLRLHPMDVLLEDEETYATRWTLGPEWYQDNVENEDILPYCSDVDDDLTSDGSVKAAQVWAAAILRRTSNYRIVGWLDDVTPQLTHCQHTLTINTMNPTVSHTITGDNVHRGLLSTLQNADQIMVLRGHATHGHDETQVQQTITYIPVRSITSVQHVMETRPIS